MFKSLSNGRQYKATLMVCPECWEVAFRIMAVEGLSHLHYQCACCEQVFCEGCELSLPDKKGGNQP